MLWVCSQILRIRCVNLFVKLLVAEAVPLVVEKAAGAVVAVVHQQVVRHLRRGTAVGHVGPLLIYVIQEALQSSQIIAACAGSAHKDFFIFFYLNNFLCLKDLEVSRAIFLPSLVKENEVLGLPVISFLFLRVLS